ncbi:hypothetical protein NE237_003417 [Protea cynaroides]|uniref:Protein kinase domain-containing protein n=1 Tax=Protea cynaroides TaxID=273540 RepID=A0A9Q0QSK6_9MAGN|nr:hypothetical protein NE237_003417 [Protea cynaroides]
MHHQFGEVVVVKSAELLRSKFLQREHSILSVINSPGIVGYVGCDVTNENGHLLYILFIDYIFGGTITDAIRDQGGRLHESEIRSHTRSILQGVKVSGPQTPDSKIRKGCGFSLSRWRALAISDCSINSVVSYHIAENRWSLKRTERMFDDQDLGFFANFLGIFIFVLVIAYHYVMADPKYEAN